MRRNIPIIFSILILFILILYSGCLTPSSEQNTQQDVGLIGISEQAGTSRISFDEAKATLVEYRINALHETANVTTVHYMRSRDVDGSGNASGWIFGVYEGNMAEFLEYDRTGWTTIKNATLPSDAIDLDNVVSPELLFKKNKEIITGKPSAAISERRDIELQRSIYTLTIISGSTLRTLTFNATTGELIS